MDIRNATDARSFVRAWTGNPGKRIMCKIAAEGQESCARLSGEGPSRVRHLEAAKILRRAS